MGLLDDAIREHLDLKRRRGADPNEIERLEREALGPVRRPQAESFGAPDEAGPAQGYQQDERADWADAPGESSFLDHGTEFEEDDEFEDWDAPDRGPVQSDERGAVEGGVGVEPDLPDHDAPIPPSPTKEAPSSDSLDEEHYREQETVEHDVEAEHRQHTEEDDMLEETPEFLQDTPDHDRLWFEQRPPRDFDLDG